MANLFDLTEWPTVATHLYEKYASMLSERICRRFPKFDPAQIYDAVIGAVLDVALKIDQLDNTDDLGGLLSVAAVRKLLGSHRSEQARQGREEKKGKQSVAQHQSAARKERDQLADREMLERIFAAVPNNDEELVVLEHWGESYQEIARALGWQDLPDPEQKRRVKTIRDRLGKRLARFLEE
jgi:DNA-directed RNA polymerase specialized sigma24 family protein